MALHIFSVHFSLVSRQDCEYNSPILKNNLADSLLSAELTSVWKLWGY